MSSIAPLSINWTAVATCSARLALTSVSSLTEIPTGLKHPKEHIHIIWYCIHHETNRLEETEVKWLHSLEEKNVPAILILSQYLGAGEESEFLKYLKSQNLPVHYPVHYIVLVLACDKAITRTITILVHGLEHLIGCTLELLPEVARLAFIQQQLLRVDLKAEAAWKFASGYVGSAAFIGAAPIPFADAPLLVTVEVALSLNISRIFGRKASPEFCLSLIGALAGIGLAPTIGRAIVFNLLKLIPVAGSTTQSATAATITLAIAYVYIEVMKAVAYAEIKGNQLLQSEIEELLREQYFKYVGSKQAEQKAQAIVRNILKNI